MISANACAVPHAIAKAKLHQHGSVIGPHYGGQALASRNGL
jgi:hypothetical protein